MSMLGRQPTTARALPASPLASPGAAPSVPDPSGGPTQQLQPTLVEEGWAPRGLAVGAMAPQGVVTWGAQEAEGRAEAGSSYSPIRAEGEATAVRQAAQGSTQAQVRR